MHSRVILYQNEQPKYPPADWLALIRSAPRSRTHLFRCGKISRGVFEFIQIALDEKFLKWLEENKGRHSSSEWPLLCQPKSPNPAVVSIYASSSHQYYQQCLYLRKQKPDGHVNQQKEKFTTQSTEASIFARLSTPLRVIIQRTMAYILLAKLYTACNLLIDFQSLLVLSWGQEPKSFVERTKHT